MSFLEKNTHNDWQLFIQKLSENLPENEVEAWANDLKLVEIKKDKIILGGLNHFFCNWVKEHHRDLLKTLLFDVFQKHHIAPHFELILNIETKEHKALVKNNTRDSNGLLEQNNFASFVNGNNTAMAVAAARFVAENITSTKYNPLFICGDVGLGKTHLMQAIGLRAKEKINNLNVLYCSAEQFTNEVIESIRFNKTHSTRKKYRSVDLLLIDDIQFFQNKDRTLDEFFYTFNDLIHDNKHIVITSDRYPREIPNIEERITSRLSSGMVVKIEPPDFETRGAIIQNLVERMNLEMSNEVIEHIAHAVRTNIREIKGVLLKLEAEWSLLKQEISLESARIILKEVLNLDKSPKSIDEIIRYIAKKLNVKTADILSEKRDREISIARQIAMYVTRKITDSSYPVIGKYFEKNHSSVIQACKKIKILMEEDAEQKQVIQSIIRELSI